MNNDKELYYKYKYNLYKKKYLNLKEQMGGVKEKTFFNKNKEIIRPKIFSQKNGQLHKNEPIEKQIELLERKLKDEKLGANKLILSKKLENLKKQQLKNMVHDIEAEHLREPEAQPRLEIDNTYHNRVLTRIEVDNIHYTQKTISHSFTDNRYSITSTIDIIKNDSNKKPLNIEQIGRILGTDSFNLLDCIITKERIIYCCNNRRLCTLKTLKNLGLFDGFVNVKITDNCTHPIEISNNVLVSMGNKPSQTC